MENVISKASPRGGLEGAFGWLESALIYCVELLLHQLQLVAYFYQLA